MKKSLFALAALTAFAGAASAQSSVTVYGILDVGYVGANTRQASNQTAAATPTNQNQSQIGDGGQSTNRLGFKGTEDLGGGLSAFFTIETALTPEANQSISTGATANRQTFVGLKKNGIGNFSIGTQYTALHNEVAVTDPGMQNNVGGNVIYDRGFAAAGTSGAPVNIAMNSGSSSPYGVNSSYQVRANNMLAVNTDTFAGFTGHAFYVQNGQSTNASSSTTGTTTTTAGGSTKNAAWGVAADYAWNKLFVTGAYQSFKETQGAAVTTANGQITTQVALTTAGGIGGASAAGVNSLSNEGYAAATYDFGILKAYVQYVSRKVSDTYDNSSYMKRTAQQVGVRSYITPTIEAWASAGNGNITLGTSGTSQAYGQPTQKFTGYQLGSNYWLSKRTNLYAIFGATQSSNIATTNASGVNTGGFTAFNGNNYAMGVRHTF